MAGTKRTLEQILLEYAGKPKAGNAARNYATFMAHWDEIQAMHAKGWSYLVIWKAMTEEGIFTFSYPSLTSYIRKVERRQEKAAASKPPQQYQPRMGRAEAGQNHSPPTKDISGESARPRRF